MKILVDVNLDLKRDPTKEELSEIRGLVHGLFNNRGENAEQLAKKLWKLGVYNDVHVSVRG